MNHMRTEESFERRVKDLADPEELAREMARHEKYEASLLPRMLAELLVLGGGLVYGSSPSYLKFRALEVIARVPYHSWQAVGFVLMTLFYTDEKRALRLAETEDFARIAQDNETMHVVVISALAKQEEKIGLIRGDLIPLLFAGIYFLLSTVLFCLCKRWSFELNYLFERHAFDQYQRFLIEREKELKGRSMKSSYLTWYGRRPASQYDFFLSVRNDELLHRNCSIYAIKAVR